MTLTQIIDTICATLRIEKEDLLGIRKTRDLADARKIYCIVSREFTKFSTPKIGKAINRSHSNVVLQTQAGYCLAKSDDDFADLLDVCRRAVKLISVEDGKREMLAVYLSARTMFNLKVMAFNSGVPECALVERAVENLLITSQS